MTMYEYIIDLESFSVEAETEEEACDIAIQMLADGAAEIDQIFQEEELDE